MIKTTLALAILVVSSFAQAGSMTIVLSNRAEAIKSLQAIGLKAELKGDEVIEFSPQRNSEIGDINVKCRLQSQRFSRLKSGLKDVVVCVTADDFDLGRFTQLVENKVNGYSSIESKPANSRQVFQGIRVLKLETPLEFHFDKTTGARLDEMTSLELRKDK